MEDARKSIPKKIEKTRATPEQLRFYLQYVKQHPQLSAGKYNPKAPNALWQQLADNLNSIRGPTRTTQKWKESLYAWRKNLRFRARKLNNATMETDGKSAVPQLSDFEKMALEVFGTLAITGLPSVPTLGVETEQISNTDYNIPLKTEESCNSPFATITTEDSCSFMTDTTEDSCYNPLSETPTTKTTKKTKKFDDVSTKSRATAEQLRFFVQYAKDHPELYASKYNSKAPNVLWQQLADNLNDIRGPTRTVQKWKDSLSGWKKTLRFRARKFKAATMATDGKTAVPHLSDFEKMALEVFGTVAVTGLPSVPMLGVETEQLSNTSLHIPVKTEESCNSPFTTSTTEDSCSFMTDTTEDSYDNPLSETPTTTIKKTKQFDDVFELLKESIKQRNELQQTTANALNALATAINNLNETLKNK